MNLIKVSTDMQLSIHEFPDGSYEEQNRLLCNLIGNGCSTYEKVKPGRLYSELQIEHYLPGLVHKLDVICKTGEEWQNMMRVTFNSLKNVCVAIAEKEQKNV